MFWPIDRAYDGDATRTLQSLGVETFHAPFAGSVASLLRARGSRIDTILACRYHVAHEILPIARKLAPKARIVFDSVDLHYLRERRQAELTGDAALLRLAAHTRRMELNVVASSDATIVVSPAEAAEVISALPGSQVHILSNIHEVAGRGPRFAARKDIVFVGGFRHLPNADGVRWFLSEVFPIVRSRLPQVQFHCIGNGPPEDVLALASTPGVNIHGHVAELDPFMENVRLSIAPLRFGAGVKGKINMSLAHGQPVVATSVGVEGMHLRHDVDVLVADDPATFASCVVRLYEDEHLWNRLATNGLKNVEQHFSMTAARDVIRRVLLAP
jgi:glycosyltransferase involved in cell wall biosynthesis